MSAHTQTISGALTDPNLTNTMLNNPGPGALSVAFWGITCVSSISHNAAGVPVSQPVTLAVNGVTVITYNLIVIGVNTSNVGPLYQLDGQQYLLPSGANVTLTTVAGPNFWRHNLFAAVDITAGS